MENSKKNICLNGVQLIDIFFIFGQSFSAIKSHRILLPLERSLIYLSRADIILSISIKFSLLDLSQSIELSLLC